MASANSSLVSHKLSKNSYVFIKPPYEHMAPATLQRILEELKTFRQTITDTTELEKNKKFFSGAITMWHKCEFNKTDNSLIQCHYKMAVFNYYSKEFNESVLRATVGLNLSPNNPMLLFVRAKSYIELNKRYAALSDILQACVLVHFKIDAFNNLLMMLTAGIGK